MLRNGLAMVALFLCSGASPPDTFEGVETFRVLRLSAELARAGIRAEDPLLLLAAARLRRSAPVNPDAGTPDRALEWVAKAEFLGSDDPRIATLANDIRTELKKGRSAGPRVLEARLKAGERRSFSETFKAGWPAVVYIEGDGDTDLTLRVGATCRETGPGDIKICSWKPARSERVRVEIGNVGTIENRVIIGTN